jgi:Sec-independent protein translocase protein TatA
MLTWGEILVIIIVAIIVIKPEDWPSVFKTCSKIFKKIISLKDDSRKFINKLHSEMGVDEITGAVKYIKGDDGKIYEAYDISDIRPKSNHTLEQENDK